MKLAAVAAGLAGVVTLSGCGASGVMHDGTVGAYAGGVSVSADQVQQAVAQINSTANSTTQQVSAADVIPFIVLAPKFDQLADKYGLGVTNPQIAKLFPHTKLEPATLDAYRANYIYMQLRNSGKAAEQQAATDLISKTDITVNPRFGAVDQGQSANRSANWITYLPANSAELGAPGMRPAGN